MHALAKGAARASGIQLARLSSAKEEIVLSPDKNKIESPSGASKADEDACPFSNACCFLNKNPRLSCRVPATCCIPCLRTRTERFKKFSTSLRSSLFTSLRLRRL